jgi:histidinol-phosphate aminotransferase
MILDANENPYQNGVNRYPDPQRSVKAVLPNKET